MSIKQMVGKVGVIVAGSLMTVGFAMADAVDTAITAEGTTASSYIADALGVALIVAGGFFGIRLMKKAFSASA